MTEEELKELAEDRDKTQAIWFTYLWQLLHIDTFLRLSEDDRRRAVTPAD